MDTLLVERNAGVVTVTMNRPEKKNAANGAMFEELLAIFREVEATDTDRCLLLTGAGGNFCTGADLSAGDGPMMDLGRPGIVRMRRLHDVALALHNLNKPTVAKVDGLAVGAGLSFALGCDLIVATERARFSMIFAKRGLTPDMGASWLLPRQIGMARAKELTFSGELLHARSALGMGLINEIHPLDEIDAAAWNLASRLASGPTVALGLAKSLLNNAFSVPMGQALEDESRAQAINFHSTDTAEAISAFLERREPEFRGR
jgi:2-(1,2-epoxy-1,2-dihydrophenyl)acetyl-CoA isomerase